MRGATAVQYVNRCIKFDLPNGKTVDLLSEALNKMIQWKQDDNQKTESCGFILGYKNSETGNITLSDITTPQKGDYRSRCFCKLKDKLHFELIKRNIEKKNFYMGVWHTHPENTPSPSFIDYRDWNEILEKDSTGSEFAFFIIIGQAEFKMWVGSYETNEILEVYEAKIIDGIYVKDNSKYEN